MNRFTKTWLKQLAMIGALFGSTACSDGTAEISSEQIHEGIEPGDALDVIESEVMYVESNEQLQEMIQGNMLVLTPTEGVRGRAAQRLHYRPGKP